MALPLGILEHKAALDAGFDIEPVEQDGWWRLGVSGLSGACWVRPAGQGATIALSLDEQVAELTTAHGPGLPLSASPSEPHLALIELPVGATGALYCPPGQSFLSALRRIRHALATVPARLVERLDDLTATVGNTEALALVKRRVGQDLYRNALLSYWNGACAVTGLAVPELLRASHAKSWKDATDQERLDVHNGFLLAAHLDALFDSGLMTFDDDGRMLVSPRLAPAALVALGLKPAVQRLRWIHPAHRTFLNWHRKSVFTRD